MLFSTALIHTFGKLFLTVVSIHRQRCTMTEQVKTFLIAKTYFLQMNIHTHTPEKLAGILIPTISRERAFIKQYLC